MCVKLRTAFTRVAVFEVPSCVLLCSVLHLYKQCLCVLLGKACTAAVCILITSLLYRTSVGGEAAAGQHGTRTSEAAQRLDAQECVHACVEGCCESRVPHRLK